jgi:nitrite reductase (NADH) large subunit
MNVVTDINSPELASSEAEHPKDPVVVVGGGPVGTRTAQELSRRGQVAVLLNAERWRPYNRVKLTPLLAGEAQLGQIYASDHFPRPGSVYRYDGVSVVDIDRESRVAYLSTGRVQPYSKLVLALGSRAFVPSIQGADLPGVYTFRNFDDTEALLARSMSARNVVVIGGGLLGLEAARGMARRGAQLTVVEHETRLMPRQLDLEAGKVLKERITALGINVIVGERVQSVLGDSRVEKIVLSNGSEVQADTVIVCTGVRANTQLPSGIGLSHNRGVLVDDRMRTSDPDIYAVGECAEHDGQVYGLVGPGFEQAAVAVAGICGDETQRYRGSIPATKLKVLGADVFSAGDFESIEQQPDVRSGVYAYPETGVYRRIFVDRGWIVAALGVGDWPEATKLQQAVNRRQPVRFWHLARFRKTGNLWRDKEDGVAAWPKDAIVCNCTGITKAAIMDSITLGADTLDDVRATTSANTVCGTCKPLIQDLLGQGDAKPEPARWWKWLVGISAICALAALAIAFLPRISMADTFIRDDLFRSLWFDSIWKQYSGYALLALTAAAALIGLRKRIRPLSRLGSYEAWRLIHLFIGIAAALILVAHTGFRLGSNLNLVLMVSFLVTLVFGAAAGFVTGSEHELQDRGLTGSTVKPRSVSLWIHILAIWPLPVLLAVHILTVYAF